MSKVHKKVREKILGIWFFLLLEVKNNTILIFKVIFYNKNQWKPFDFFPLKNMKKGEQFLLLTYFDNFDI